MKFWGNLIGYQIVWFSAVIGAGRGLWWPGVLAAAAFALWQLSTSSQPRAELRLIPVAIVCGTLLDGGLALSGFARYAAGEPALFGGAPLWIVSLWAAFSLTLLHSMTFLLNRPVIAAVFGAIGGPLAYLGAARGWQAIVFVEPRWTALLMLAIGWGLAIPLLSMLAGRWSQPALKPQSA